MNRKKQTISTTLCSYVQLCAEKWREPWLSFCRTYLNNKTHVLRAKCQHLLAVNRSLETAVGIHLGLVETHALLHSARSALTSPGTAAFGGVHMELKP